MATSILRGPLVAAVLLSLPVLPASAAAQDRGTTSFQTVLSTGAFGLPADANSVDWVILNESSDTQTVQVTIWRLTMGGLKVRLAPGTLTLRLSPGTATHGANPVGGAGPFQLGYYFEILVATNDRRVLPTVEIWSDRGARTIPGARIGPRDFVALNP